MSLLYSYVMSYLHIGQGAAGWIVSLHLSKWALPTAILLLAVVLGSFLPPVSIVPMTAPIILPPLRQAGFDPIWFGAIMVVVMEMGLIHPPADPRGAENIVTFQGVPAPAIAPRPVPR